jgi:hypothetical protein
MPVPIPRAGPRCELSTEAGEPENGRLLPPQRSALVAVEPSAGG